MGTGTPENEFDIKQKSQKNGESLGAFSDAQKESAKKDDPVLYSEEGGEQQAKERTPLPHSNKVSAEQGIPALLPAA